MVSWYLAMQQSQTSQRSSLEHGRAVNNTTMFLNLGGWCWSTSTFPGAVRVLLPMSYWLVLFLARLIIQLWVYGFVDIATFLRWLVRMYHLSSEDVNYFVSIEISGCTVSLPAFNATKVSLGQFPFPLGTGPRQWVPIKYPKKLVGPISMIVPGLTHK